MIASESEPVKRHPPNLDEARGSGRDGMRSRTRIGPEPAILQQNPSPRAPRRDLLNQETP